MKNMVDKVLDSILPIFFGAGGGVAGAVSKPICVIPITLDEVIAMAISAVIFATIGAVIGWSVNKLLNAICKKKK